MHSYVGIKRVPFLRSFFAILFCVPFLLSFLFVRCLPFMKGRHQVHFHVSCVLRTATNYRALLRKMTYKGKASHGSSPLCIKCIAFVKCSTFLSWNQMRSFVAFLFWNAVHSKTKHLIYRNILDARPFLECSAFRRFVSWN